MPFGGTQGPALRVVPLLMHCGGECLSAGREAPPYGLCHDNAVVLRPTGPDSRGRLSLRIVPLLMHCGGECLSAGREAPALRCVPRWCIVVGNAFRRDARPRPTGCASFDALRWGLPFGGTRGPALRVVPRFCCDKKHTLMA